MKYHTIGTIHSPYRDIRGMPIQASTAVDVEETVDLIPEYVEWLKDLDGFSRIILIYHFHLSKH
jgi:tRNA (Thr-GGU) A37 N-methylase